MTILSYVLAFLVAIGSACAPGGERLAGRGGRAAALGILLLATVPVSVRSDAAPSAAATGAAAAATVFALLAVLAFVVVVGLMLRLPSSSGRPPSSAGTAR